MNPAFLALKRLGNVMNARRKKLRIILDPGHGNPDPGAVGNDGSHEALEVAEFALTLKYCLTQIPGVEVVISRAASKPTWAARTFGLGAADLAVALHMDTANGTGRSMAYYAAGRDYTRGPDAVLSRQFGECLKRACPDPEFTVQADATSRFGRLYIRGFLAPIAVLWEIDPVHDLDRPERLTRAAQFCDALADAIARGVVSVR